MSGPSQVVVIATLVGGRDGLSELGRQVVRASSDDGNVPVTVFSLDDAACPDALAGASIRFVAARGRRWRLIADVARASLSWGPATRVIVMHAQLLPLALPAAARGSQLVLLLVGIESWRPFSWLQRRAARRAGAVVAISAHTAARFKTANPALADVAVQVCHPAVPPPAHPSPSDQLDGYALIVGRMWSSERYKGHDELLEAWPAVRASHPDARLVIAGDGDDRPRLMAKAAALGLSDVTRFAGAVDAGQLAAFYRDCAFFVMPSRDEGFGFVFLEAMRAGRPCIASPGAAAEFIVDGVNGLLVESGNVDGVAAACLRLFADEPLRARLGREAADAVSRGYQFTDFAARWRTAMRAGDQPC